MNFINKIMKPKEGEPNLRQAHTGQELQARFDENLKRWIFPGEVSANKYHFLISTFRRTQAPQPSWFRPL
jgi:hypothetical protein